MKPTCELKKGNEQHKKIIVRGKMYCHYDYRDLDGELFSCVKPTLAEARAAVKKQLAVKFTARSKVGK